MKSLKWMRGAVALAVMTGATWAIAADHIDSPSATADPTSDITDLYTWVDGNNAVFVLNVTPFATVASKFSDKVQYVVHTESAAMFGAAGTKLDIICTFKVDQTISCWVGDKDYVTGDASAKTGLSSASGKVKVFAGLRDDPFFFNLDGFKATVSVVDGAETAMPAVLSFDGAGCPTLPAGVGATLVNQLKTAKGGGAAVDAFLKQNVLSIVLSVDKTLINSGGAFVATWASTNKGS